MGYRDIIDNFKPYDYSKYQAITSHEKLMLFTATILEKNNIPLTFNYLCISTFRLFPDKFCLDDEFKDFPSVDRLNRTYMHLKYVKKGTPYITGTQESGFKLTAFGRALAKETEAIINNSVIDKTIKAPTVDMHKSGSVQDYKKFINSEVYIKYSTQGLIDLDLLWKYYNVIPYTQMSKIKNNLNEIKKYASTQSDNICGDCVKKIIERM